ncbi:MAG: YqhA family protein [Chloroflexales bacterium]|nr:YqhA family protein [Chloroflexales bacterium]
MAAQPARRVAPSGDIASPLSQSIGRSRYVVLLAVIAVLLVAISLFLLGALQALLSIWEAWAAVARGELNTTDMTVQFLEIVSTMLKAVVFYIIGVGLYSLFIAPLNLTISLGVETLNDLETKIVSVVIVILAVTFLEHFIAWEAPLDTLMFGAALALVVGTLVLFQQYNHRAKEGQVSQSPEVQARAQQRLFEQDEEQHVVEPAQVDGTNK